MINLYKKLLSTRWEIGFVKNSMEDIVERKPLQYTGLLTPLFLMFQC